MSHADWDEALRRVLAPARSAEPTDAEVMRALRAAADAPARRHRHLAGLAPRPVVAAASAVAIIAGASYAAPPTRAAIDSALSNLTGWLEGNDATSEDAAELDQAPGWVKAMKGERRLVAESGEARLYAVGQPDGTIAFALGEGVGLQDSAEGWRRTFADEPLVVLGPDARPDAGGRRALYGLTARSVTRVELRYRSGPVTTGPASSGGFVLLADSQRPAVALVAIDARGDVIATRDVRYLNLTASP